jgi:curved DNA-binding protein
MSNLDFKNYYKILGIESSATPAEIKTAFRRLARKYHPDVNKAVDAHVKMSEVNEANDVLGNAEKRAAYDKVDKDWQANANTEPPPGWNSGFEFDHSVNDFDEQFLDRSPFFEALFGAAQRRAAADQGYANTRHAKRPDGYLDRFAKIVIPLEDAFNGSVRDIRLQKPNTAPDGTVFFEEHVLQVTIPKGIRAGQVIRLKGQGASDALQKTVGNMLLEIEFLVHPLFKVVGDDIYLTVPVAPWEAALGKRIAIPTPGGDVEIGVPECSQQGRKLRLKGRGLPGPKPGDMYAMLEIAVPPTLDDNARILFEKMQKEIVFNPRQQFERHH